MSAGCSGSGFARRRISRRTASSDSEVDLPMSRNASAESLPSPNRTPANQREGASPTMTPRALQMSASSRRSPRLTPRDSPSVLARLTPRTTRTPSRRTPTSRAGQTAVGMNISEKALENIIKKAQAPLREEIQSVKKELASINKTLSGIDSGVQNMGRQSKEILNNVDQKKGTLGNSLTMTGSITLKSICFLNLNLEVNSAAENNLLKEFIDDAKENMWLLSDSSKNIRDIGLRFREERNTLKTQTKRHVKEDFGNTSVDNAAELSRTKSYLTKHIGEISEEVSHLLHLLAFIMAKYLNSKKKMVEAEDKEVQKLAINDLFKYLNRRKKRDTATDSELKEKIKKGLEQ